MSKSAAQTFALDLVERTVSTFAQGAAGAGAVILIGANTQNVVHADIYQQAGAAALAGGVAAVGALFKGIIAGLRTGTASASKVVAETAVIPGAHSSDGVQPISVGQVTVDVVPSVPDVPVAEPVPAVDPAAVFAAAEAIHNTTPTAS